ncbi:DNA methyltransferase [Bacillus sp. BD59S]|uniref:DNA methyltransferase n=1 Tax=Bacillus sp. BD59S TaxID=2499213 RepID=UPI00117E6553|nr:DNA methyltransferase [Bacillus sp. BD59S]QDQ03674.1 class I SAM-dependent DNA methyltransferase [Bacillus sp. BD59S]
MNIAQVEENIAELLSPLNKEDFIYNFLLAYGLPKASITRLRKGNLNLSQNKDIVAWKKKVVFKNTNQKDLYPVFDELESSKLITSSQPRFIVVTNFKNILAKDMKTKDSLDIEMSQLNKYFDFFLPWAGVEKASYQLENPADVKAAEKMAKIYDELKKDNEIYTPEQTHELNILLSRLLFCFFAEDTNIFKKSQFTEAISSHTQEDGRDLKEYLNRLFEVLNLSAKDRKSLPAYLEEFPYVNGKLFEDINLTIEFSRKSRQAILECGSLDWSLINPDIFGSMIQAVVSFEYRGNMGMHYTSVPNIMKVIQPLFLDELYLEFERSKGNGKALLALLEHLTNINVFDPACGSGNFLIIAYREIRKLEMKIFEELDRLNPTLYLSSITLDQFYGIEIDDFAHEIAILSLWLTEHQMNLEFFNKFGRTNPTLPLKKSGNIIRGNALEIEWNIVCPRNVNKYVYLLGNPPYLGSKKQSKRQKEEMKKVFDGVKGYKNLDYIACWLYIGAKYISGINGQLAFVSTNSIVQGDQVGLLWPHIYNFSLEIGFAHRSFKWTNNAKSKAAVICVIVSLRNKSNAKKYLFSDYKMEVANIGPYLNVGPAIVVSKRKNQISNLPEMAYGNMPLEGGFLKLTAEEQLDLINKYPQSKKYIKCLIGGEEFLKGISRYCIWIEDNDLENATEIEGVAGRIKKVREFRENGGEVARTLVGKSHQFRYRKVANKHFILVPRTTSENRDYMQCGFFDSNYITLDSAQVIYDSEEYVFGIISSSMHMAWIKTVSGRLKLDYRYSNLLAYNTFPFPEISNIKKKKITEAVYKIIYIRECFSEKTIAELYTPGSMPEELKKAHLELDEIIDKCYRNKPFINEDERVEHLFNLYKELIQNEVK